MKKIFSTLCLTIIFSNTYAKGFDPKLLLENNSTINNKNFQKYIIQTPNTLTQSQGLVVLDNVVYTINDSKNNGSAISKFNLNTGQIYGLEANELLGHQGLSYASKYKLFWTSASSSIKNYGLYAVSFHYPNLNDSIKLIKVFPEKQGYSGENSMPTFTPDGNFLIVRANKNQQGIVRIYNIKNVDLTKVNDLTELKFKEITVDNNLINHNGFPLQGLAADSNNIYFLSGGGAIKDRNNKSFTILSYNGKIKPFPIDLGNLDSYQYSSKGYWEPEGLFFDSKFMYILFAVGDNTISIIYKISLK